MKGTKLLVLFLAIIILTGCGSKTQTLSCSNNEDMMGIETKQSMDIEFKDTKISNVKMIIDMTLPSSVASQWDTVVKTLDEQYKNMNGDGLTLNTKDDKENLKYTVTINVDTTKATKKSLSSLNMSDLLDSSKPIDEVKKDAESDGFKCSIK